MTLPGVDVDDRDEVVVFVGDVEPIAVGMQDQELRIGPRRQSFDVFERLCVVNFHVVVVAGADDDPLAVIRHNDAAWALADLGGLDDFQLFGVDNRDGVVLLVGHVGSERICGTCGK